MVGACGREASEEGLVGGREYGDGYDGDDVARGKYNGLGKSQGAGV